MTQIAEETNMPASDFPQGIDGVGLPWLDELRKASLARFNHVGFPNPKEEAWRHTNLAPIRNTRFAPAKLVIDDEVTKLAREFTFGGEAAVELVFVNGHYVPSLSKLGKLPRGVRISSLSDALMTDGALIEKHLGQYADIEHNPFVALNTGSMSGGALLHFARGSSIDGPVHLLLISTSSDEPTISHPRVLVILEDNVKVQVVQSSVGMNRGAYLSNLVTEIIAGEDCVIDHCTLQQQGDEALQISTTQVALAARSNFISHVATLGGKLTRNDLNVVMGGERAEATLNGLIYLREQQHCDNHTLLDHAQPNCPSHELYKYVLADKSSGVFKGKILVRPGAQKTDSKQTSKSLLLSDDALMNSQPALEIYADDVKCTHGSTTGPVDEDQIFYLRSRGVGYDAARHLLTYAFAADVTRRIKVAPVRRRLEDFLAAQQGLPQDLRIADLAAHDERAVNL